MKSRILCAALHIFQLLQTAQSTPDYVVTTIRHVNETSANIGQFVKASGQTSRAFYEGLLFVNNHAAISVLHSNGTIQTLAGSRKKGYNDGPALTALFEKIEGVEADDAGNLYIADAGNNAIRMLDNMGFVSTIAGKPTTKPELERSGGDQGLLNGPSDVLLRRRPCSLLVSDLGNHRLLSISLPASSCVSSTDDGWTWFDCFAVSILVVAGCLLWELLLRTFPTWSDALVAGTRNVYQRFFTRGAGEYAPPRDLLYDVEAPPLIHVAEQEQAPSTDTISSSPEHQTTVQIVQEAAPEETPEDAALAAAGRSASPSPPIPISTPPGVSIEQLEGSPLQAGASSQIFSMSPEGWEKVEEEVKSSPEATASHFVPASTDTLREDYFADLNPLRKEKTEGKD
ncbi:hypothetical protein KFL_000670160 [Klebsormidium nitens]|uniref:NHL repeat-containing protein n=1 Tax=Klebsormidium nitens TaxID=105231 RepID=A0A1Y1HYL4_KLENI|nr:hypothetical protein KFL_000670160 [Klebsormidium nitens]|eukprot:GAQ80958.1 hypothetical protein KFL_000670160 [Klebsormidium nitens]